MAKFNFSSKQWLELKNMLENEPLSTKSKKDVTPTWCRKFESAFANKFGVASAVAFNSCTSSIQAALLALGVGQNDQVIVSPITSYTSILQPMAIGAVPVFCDVEEESLSINPNEIFKHINDKTKVVLLPYMYGLPSKIKRIKKICQSNEVFLIEDCAHVPGLMINNKPAGTSGEIGCFSFAEGKILDCGEGGIAITNNKTLAEEMVIIKEGGKRAFRVYSPHGANFKMTNFNAYLALYQLKRLNYLLNKREEIAQIYFSKVPKGIYPANNKKNCIKSVALFKSNGKAKEVIHLLSQRSVTAKDIYLPLNESNVFSDERLLFEALGKNKMKFKEFQTAFYETPVAKKAFKDFFYIETDPLRSIHSHTKDAKAFARLQL